MLTGAVSDDGFDVLNVEAIAPDVTLRGRIQIEQYPFMSRPARERGLDMAARRAWLDELASACRERGQGRIDAELRFFREQGDAALVRFYDGLRQEAHTLDAHSFLLQIGWGGGWGSKTLDDRLSGAEGFAEIVRRYNLDEPRRRGSRFASGDRFPASRKVVLNGGTPWWPLGWARGTVVER
jgi:CRISPR-associated protein Csm5